MSLSSSNFYFITVWFRIMIGHKRCNEDDEVETAINRGCQSEGRKELDRAIECAEQHMSKTYDTRSLKKDSL